MVLGKSKMTEDRFSSIYKANYKDLYHYGIRLGFSHETCLDALQDVFYKLLIRSNPIDDDGARAYLFRSLRNRLIDMMRVKTEMSYEDITDQPFSVEVTIEDEMIENEEVKMLKQKVESLMSMLTNRQREIIYLRYMEEMEYEDIGKLLQMKPESVRKAVNRGIELIRQLSKK
jgi:RNA polymerase sigma factor (sigma-70 family)